MRFDGAVIKEQGITFAIVVVKKHVLDSSSEKEHTINGFSVYFPQMPIILMAQNHSGIPTYYGRRDIVNFLSRISPSRIPFRTYTV